MLIQFSTEEFNSRKRLDGESLSLLHGVAVCLVDLEQTHAVEHPGLLPCVVVGRLPSERMPGHSGATACDVLVTSDRDLDEILMTIERAPQAAVATALLLRGVENRSVEESLIAESTTYSLLQSGSEFAHWKSTRLARRVTTPPDSIILSERTEGHLTITLNNPLRRNAYSSLMRSRLAEILQLAVSDETVSHVSLRGAGNNFSSGGDLDEFGSFTDALSSHFSRLTSSVASSLWSLNQRLGTSLRCDVMGENFGAGVELAAFAGYLSARQNARFCLPEVSLGLVPGAGGTASIPRRIGRQRTAWLALTGRSIDAQTALEWGLIDEISE